MPSPEQLGVRVRSAESSSNATGFSARIKELGIMSYHLDTSPDGRCRFTCWLPRERPGLSQRLESLAATEAEAVRLGLERAAQSRAGRP